MTIHSYSYSKDWNLDRKKKTDSNPNSIIFKLLKYLNFSSNIPKYFPSINSL